MSGKTKTQKTGEQKRGRVKVSALKGERKELTSSEQKKIKGGQQWATYEETRPQDNEGYRGEDSASAAAEGAAFRSKK